MNPPLHGLFANDTPVKRKVFSNKDSAIEAIDLNVALGEQLILDSLNVRIPSQKFTAIIGPKGVASRHCSKLSVEFYNLKRGQCG